MNFSDTCWESISPKFIPLIIAIALWEVVWKAFALWSSAQRKEKVWFVLLLIINSAGILPIVYLLINKKR